MATVHDDNQRVELGPPYSSARLPRDTSLYYPWVAHALTLIHPGGMVGHRLTRQPMKLLSLYDSINPVYAST
jgi:hypothetical protein